MNGVLPQLSEKPMVFTYQQNYTINTLFTVRDQNIYDQNNGLFFLLVGYTFVTVEYLIKRPTQAIEQNLQLVVYTRCK